MDFAVSLALAPIAAAAAGYAGVFVPDQWIPFFRAGVATGAPRSAVTGAYVFAKAAQAAGSAIVGLLVTIFVLGVISASDAAVQAWAGAVVMLISGLYFRAHRRQGLAQWDLASQLVAAAERGTGRRRKSIEDPFGAFDGSLGGLVRSAAASPGFALSPMFIVAAASGSPNVWNAAPAILSYVIATTVGAVVAMRGIAADMIDEHVRMVALRQSFAMGVVVLALGLVAMILGLL